MIITNFLCKLSDKQVKCVILRYNKLQYRLRVNRQENCVILRYNYQNFTGPQSRFLFFHFFPVSHLMTRGQCNRPVVFKTSNPCSFGYRDKSGDLEAGRVSTVLQGLVEKQSFPLSWFHIEQLRLEDGPSVLY